MWAAIHTGISAWLPEHPLACLFLGVILGVVLILSLQKK